jgi:hypothetical protein
MYQDDSRETALAVPDGFILVPAPQTGAYQSQMPEWIASVPPFDPESAVERWWSLIMRWPRRLAVAFLYCSLTWRRSAVLAVVIAALISIVRAYA